MGSRAPRIAAALVCAAAATVPASDASACIIADAQETLIHSRLPRTLPAGTIVARVVFDEAERQSLYRTGLRARIRDMIQGEYSGDFLIVRPRFETSCDAPFANGRSGFIVGVADGIEEGVLVVMPIMVSRGDGFRLPRDYRVHGALSEAQE